MLVGMPSTVRATRNVVSPIDPTDGERHFLHLFRHCKISSWIHYLWEVHYLSYLFFHIILTEKHKFYCVSERIKVLLY